MRIEVEDVRAITEETYLEGRAWVPGNADIYVHVTPGYMTTVGMTKRGPYPYHCPRDGTSTTPSYAFLRQMLARQQGRDLRVILMEPLDIRDLIVGLIRGGMTRGHIDVGVYSVLEYARLV